MNQRVIQKKNGFDREQPIYARAKTIATTKNIHKATVGDIWLVESESKKGRFYCVQELDKELICDCPAFTYGLTNPCKHILSIAVKEAAG